MPKHDPITASHAVLIEVANALGALREHFVLIGGWVPDLLYPGQNHMGSLDVDLAVSPSAQTGNAYTTICKRLIDAGYTLQTSPTRFIKSVEGVEMPVKVDIISGQYRVGGKLQTLQVDELAISTLRGVDLAFDACDEIEIKGDMPDGTQNTVRVRVVRPEAFILIKAFAMSERLKDKDAYDIAFVLRHYKPKVEALAQPLRPLIASGLGAEGYRILQSKFEALGAIGPAAAAREAQIQGEDIAQAQRAAFEYAQALFNAVENQGDPE